MKSFWDQLIPLLPVIVGATIALMGGWIKHWAERRDDRTQRRREKLEHLLHLVFSLKPWSDSLDGVLAFGTETEQLDSPIEEIEVIGNMYFQDLLAEIDAVVNAAKLYKGGMLTLCSERLQNGRISENAKTRVAELYGPLLEAIRQLASKARSEAKKLP
jgi:hypothetical protein